MTRPRVGTPTVVAGQLDVTHHSLLVKPAAFLGLLPGAGRATPTAVSADAETGVWTRKPDLPQPAYAVGLGVFGCDDRCRLLAAGGYAAGGFTDAAFVYDTRSERWAAVAPLPAP